MELEELVEVHKDVNDLHNKLFDFIRRLVMICREYNYLNHSNHTGTMKLGGFKLRNTLSAVDIGTVFKLKYKRELLIEFRYFMDNHPDAKHKIKIYTDGYFVDIQNMGLIKEFAAEIKKNIEVINISMGDII